MHILKSEFFRAPEFHVDDEPVAGPAQNPGVAPNHREFVMFRMKYIELWKSCAILINSIESG